MASLDVVTILFTDIEHSTRLAQQLRLEYANLLAKYREVIRDVLDKHGGTEIDVAGDGFFITFKAPEAAVISAVEIQSAFNTLPWATIAGLKVRMGIHTGAALCAEEGVTGVEVHLGARVCDAAHGGQVLLSGATRQLLQEADNGYSFKALGKFKFRDFSFPVELFQLVIPGVSQVFPPPRIEKADKRLAVLPYLNETGDKGVQYLCDGLAEELIVALGKLKGIRVVSRSLTFSLARESRDAVEIGEKLKANYLVDGTLRKVNGHYRIGSELIEIETGTNLWSMSFDTTDDNILNAEQRITRGIADSLGLSVVPGEIKAMHDRQTHNPEAFDFYLRGRRFYRQFSNRGIELALQMFEKAIEADDEYALAFAGLADCHSMSYQHYSPTKDNLEKADLASQRAIELDPSLAEALVSRAIVLSLQEKYEEADSFFQKAIAYDPTIFLGWFHYARMNFTIGRLSKAARLFEQANRVEPSDYQSLFLAAQMYDDLGNDRLAYKLRVRGVEIVDETLALNPGDTRALYLGANALVFLKEPEKSLEYAQRAVTLEPEDSLVLYNVACVYALLGMEEEALNNLEGAYDAGLTLRGWYEHDSNLDSLRDHPRFKTLMKKLTWKELKTDFFQTWQ